MHWLWPAPSLSPDVPLIEDGGMREIWHMRPNVTQPPSTNQIQIQIQSSDVTECEWEEQRSQHFMVDFLSTALDTEQQQVVVVHAQSTEGTALDTELQQVVVVRARRTDVAWLGTERVRSKSGQDRPHPP